MHVVLESTWRLKVSDKEHLQDDVAHHDTNNCRIAEYLQVIGTVTTELMTKHVVAKNSEDASSVSIDIICWWLTHSSGLHSDVEQPLWVQYRTVKRGVEPFLGVTLLQEFRFFTSKELEQFLNSHSQNNSDHNEKLTCEECMLK